MKHSLLYFIFTFFLFQTAFAQMVTLDPTFGTGGKVTNTSITSGQAIQLQSDGKIISCYLSNFSISGNVKLARFNSDGTIDTTFGTNGFVSTIVVNETGGVNMMKIQSDGKILITGFLSSNNSLNSSFIDFCTARFNTDGSLDTTFGNNGYAITGFEVSSSDTSQAIEILNDGKILVGGSTSNSSQFSTNYSSDFALVRYLNNGSIDTTFGINGKFSYNFGTITIPNTSGFSSENVTAIKINSSGKIIVGGRTNFNETLEDYSNFAFICLNSDGTIDTSFGIAGQKVVDFGDVDDFANLILTTDDKIIATGRHQYTIGTTNYQNIPLVKLLENGSFDSTFGTNGIVTTNRDSSNLIDVSSDLKIQSDGKIVCFGYTPNQTATFASLLLIRFNPNGLVDTSFNTVGYKIIDFEGTAYSSSFLIQNDVKILCSGSINFSTGCLARVDVQNLSINSNKVKSFTAFPNPFVDEIRIQSNDIQILNGTAELYDISGRKLKSYNLKSDNSVLKIDSKLASGNYILQIDSDNKKESIKIIKK